MISKSFWKWISQTIILPKDTTDTSHSNEAEIFYENIPKNIRFVETLKMISNHYIKKINQVISQNMSETIQDTYDEVLVFQLQQEHIELLNYPFFTLQPRTEEEWYEYTKDGNRILHMFKQMYFWKIDKNIFNKPILLENAPGTEFDVMIVLDVWYIVFLNKKNAQVYLQELELYQNYILDMIYCIRKKAQDVLS